MFSAVFHSLSTQNTTRLSISRTLSVHLKLKRYHVHTHLLNVQLCVTPYSLEHLDISLTRPTALVKYSFNVQGETDKLLLLYNSIGFLFQIHILDFINCHEQYIKNAGDTARQFRRFLYHVSYLFNFYFLIL